MNGAAMEDFIPHGFCLAWDPDLVMAMVLSNAVIALAYLIIGVVLAAAALRPNPPVPRWFYWSYSVFVFCCGVSHVLDDVTLWMPLYRLQAGVLAVTGMASMFAALLPITLWVSREISHRRP